MMPVSEPTTSMPISDSPSKKRKVAAVEPTGVPITSTVECMLRGRYEGLDADAPKILSVLQATDAPLIWHKHSARRRGGGQGGWRTSARGGGRERGAAARMAGGGRKQAHACLKEREKMSDGGARSQRGGLGGGRKRATRER